MSFVVRMFCVALLLCISATVAVGKFSPTGETVLKSATSYEITSVVQKIWRDIKDAGGPQIGFLYLYNDRDENSINYGNEVLPTGRDLRRILTRLPRPPFYPENPEDTNILVALPDPTQPENKGHSEHILLGQIDHLLEDYSERNKGECPNAVILGTYYVPCVSSKLDKSGQCRKPYGCTDDYITNKRRLYAAGKCVQTKYYLSARDTPGPQVTGFPRDNWHRIVGKLSGENINII